MSLKRIRLTNFKSFDELDVELGQFNVVVGANASGKSNFVQIFKFLRDIVTLGLENAISFQGGVEFLRNMKIGSSKNLSVMVVADQKFRVPFFTKKKRILEAMTTEVIYQFSIEFYRRGKGFRIAEDELTLKWGKLEQESKEELRQSGAVFRNINGSLKYEPILAEGRPEGKIAYDPIFRSGLKLPPRTLLIESPFIGPFFPRTQSFLEEVSIYDIDPKLPKKAYSITGKTQLEEDGSNLAIALKNIIENKDNRKKFSILIKEMIPFVEDLAVEKFADRSFLFKLRETYAGGLYLPASFISDGTINITALIIALYFERSPLIILEEPERNVHPFLISKLVAMFKDASKAKQIIVTTHNPEVLKYAGLENIFLISRNREGFSAISKPAEREAVKAFLENEIGIEELHAQNLLGA